MQIDNFAKRVSEAYCRGEASEAALNAMNDLCSKYDIEARFLTEGTKELPPPELLFHGASEAALSSINENEPKVSVIIPTYNRADFLCRCIDSVLAQNYSNVEIIVINDCSTDDTAERVAIRYGGDERIVYIENETNLGPGGNRRKAYLKASGDYVVFADDDDYYFEPEFFRKAVAMFIDEPSLSMVCANSIFFDEVTATFDFQPLTFCGVMQSEKFLFGFNSKYRKPNSTFPAVFNKAALDAANFAKMEMMNDASIYMRAACFGKVCMLKDWVGVYWFHESNISKNLPFDFIIQNLNEKNNIYELACRQFGVKNEEWLVEQQMYTIAYYINSGSLSRVKYHRLIKWIKSFGGDAKLEILSRTKQSYRRKAKA